MLRVEKRIPRDVLGRISEEENEEARKTCHSLGQDRSNFVSDGGGDAQQTSSDSRIKGTVRRLRQSVCVGR